MCVNIYVFVVYEIGKGKRGGKQNIIYRKIEVGEGEERGLVLGGWEWVVWGRVWGFRVNENIE